jgi:hypothetical protein
MADTAISALTAVTTPAGTDVFPGVQGGANFKWTATQIVAPHVAGADPHTQYALESALGTMSTQGASAVAITGGTITGITDLAVADGGTGSSTAAGARTNLGLVIGTDVQAQNAILSDLAGLTQATDRLPYFDSGTTAALATFTAAGRALIDDADATAQRATLGLVIGTNVQAYSAVLAATTASFLTADETKLDGIEALADVTDATNVAAAGAVMEADTTTAAMSFVVDEDDMVSNSATKVPTQQSVKAYVDASGGGATTLDGLTDVVITAPATGEVLKYNGTNWINDDDATGGGGGALNDLTDVVITAAATGDIVYYNGTNWVDQAIDPDLLTLAVPASTTISAYGATLVDDADAATAQATLGLVIGTNVQAQSAILDDLAGLTQATDKLPYFSSASAMLTADFTAAGRALIDDADATAQRATLGLVIGTNVQAYDADLATIAGLTATTNNFMVASGSAWASRTPTQAIAHLGLDADIATLVLPASTTISTFGASLIDDAAATNARTTLGLVIGTDVAAAVHTRYFEKVYGKSGTLVASTGVARMYFKRAATITNVYASVGTAPTGAAIRIDVNKNGTTIFTTQGNRPDIAVSTFADMTATPDVTSIAASDYITVDIDVIGSTVAGADLTVGIEYTESI